MANASPDDEWVSQAEVSRILGVPLYTVQRLTQTSRLIAHRVPGRACPRYHRADVEALRADPTPGPGASARHLSHTQDDDRAISLTLKTRGPDGAEFTYAFEGVGRLTLIAQDGVDQ